MVDEEFAQAGLTTDEEIIHMFAGSMPDEISYINSHLSNHTGSKDRNTMQTEL